MLMGYVCSKGESDFSVEKMTLRNFGKEIGGKSDEAYYTAKLYRIFIEELTSTGQYKLYKEIVTGTLSSFAIALICCEIMLTSIWRLACLAASRQVQSCR